MNNDKLQQAAELWDKWKLTYEDRVYMTKDLFLLALAEWQSQQGAVEQSEQELGIEMFKKLKNIEEQKDLKKD